MQSDPDPPCETPEELSEYLLTQMDEQGYFY